jgi:Phage integrase, N-terminal SAM-like domain
MTSFLGEWIDTWLHDYNKPEVRATTFDTYETLIRRHLKPALGHILLKDPPGQSISSASTMTRSRLAVCVLLGGSTLGRHIRIRGLSSVLSKRPFRNPCVQRIP